MSDIVVDIQNVSKKYMISCNQKAQYETLRERLSEAITTLRQGNLQGQTQEFWALKNINLQIERGDKVALIGLNGSGKSTLLKILSQVTEPTTGQITLNGKVTSLLEVGTGFHPELTGRENIFLNGSIMGMSKKDITNQLDNIIEFSGLEDDFLNTPVKRYSSGMQARLGFSVAAHLQSDILIVDEVLAVGDAAFQKKCIGKMDEVSKKNGKTIVFVSHNVQAVKSICNKGVLLEHGSCKFYGEINDAILQYTKTTTPEVSYIKQFTHCDQKLAQFRRAAVCRGKTPTNSFSILEEITIEIEYYLRECTDNISFFMEVVSGTEVLFCSMEAGENREVLGEREEGMHVTKVTIPAPLLRAGAYSINLYLGTPQKTPLEEYKCCLCFSVYNDLSNTDYSSYSPHRKGVIHAPLKWSSNVIIGAKS